MKSILVAPLGPYPDALYATIKEVPVEKIILISSEEYLDSASKIKKDFEKFKIDVNVIKIEGNLWEETFRVISEIKSRVPADKDVIINVGAADRRIMCAATSAAFVNGLKAIDLENGNLMPLPVLKFSYYKLLSDKKMGILRVVFKEKDCCASLEELSNKTKMSLPLIAYHINGNTKSEGLKQMGLVDTKEVRGRIKVTLTELGNLLVKGYVGQE